MRNLKNVYAQRHQDIPTPYIDNGIHYEKSCTVLIKDLSRQCGQEAAIEIMKMKPMPDGAFITNDFSFRRRLRML